MSLHCTVILLFHSRINITNNDCFFVSEYLVEIYFVGSRILIGDIGDPQDQPNHLLSLDQKVK